MLKHNLQKAWLLLALVGVPMIVRGQEDVAPVVRKEVEEDLIVTETPLTDADRDHWAFRAVTRPPLPAVRQGEWPRNGLDSFILSRLESATLTPTAEADRPALLRRLSFDLIGLPPTPVELADFESDTAPDAYERQVERLLALPGYGERWGQHWLDLARFAETDGFEHDKVRSDAWKYRDWVIAAFNENLPYDRFAQLQIAGDELDDGSQAVATMFCLSGPDMPDINDQFERRHLMLNEMTATVGAVFLGLQMGCAECHDHKYDPISQADFYRLRAVFETGVPVLKRDAPCSQLKQQRDVIPARFWIRGDHRRAGPKIEAAFPRIASEKAIGDAPTNDMSPRAAFAQWLTRPDNPLTARVMVNRVWKQHFGRGLFDTPSDVGLLNAEPSHPELLDWLASEFQARGWDLKWLHRQIVTSATYRQASRMPAGDSDWERRLQLDPNDVLYSRGTRRRLDAESIRDAMLQVSGMLTDERGGAGVMPPLPPELVETLLKGQWVTSPRAADHDRRSVYLFARRNLRYPLFEVFDRPDANASCAVRNRSTTPTQSLLLLNSELALQAARHLAGEILRESTETETPIDRLFRRAFARRPTSDETERILGFILDEHDALVKEKRSVERLALPYELEPQVDRYVAAAWVEVCLAVLNASEMLYVD
ncbi:MAG: signal peptide protein [Schlesneria sp.]|nr:signal peptide protein [Schlesneria sp.]